MANKRTARVRYDDGEASGKEQYILETYNYKNGKWEEVMRTDFVKAEGHGNCGKEYIHYTLLTEALWLVSQGYSLDI